MNVEKVGKVYQQLDAKNLHLIEQTYHEDIIFEDAVHKIEGISDLYEYFESLYANVKRCHFSISTHQQVGDEGFITWVMELEHPKLSKGNTVYVNGVSHLKFSDNKVIYHRDYFDLGEMLYENLPLLGSLIRLVKQKVGQ